MTTQQLTIALHEPTLKACLGRFENSRVPYDPEAVKESWLHIRELIRQRDGLIGAFPSRGEKYYRECITACEQVVAELKSSMEFEP